MIVKKSIWRRAVEEVLEKAEQKALKRGKPLKTYSKKDLLWYLDRGWRILSHTPVSYGAAEYWLLVKD